MLPKVSIIINCHNGAQFLNECIDSIFNQTSSDWEIIFWDNVSTDNSLDIAKSYGSKIRFFASETLLSLGQARRLAMQEARGEFIAFIDTDDIWLEDHLAIQVSFMESKSYLASYAGIQEIDSEGVVIRNVIPEFSSGPQLRNILRQFEINVPTMMLHRSLIVDYGFLFNPSILIVEEFELFVRIAVDHNIGVIHEVLAQYRVHDGGLTQSTPLIAAKERNSILKQLINDRPQVYEKYKDDFSAAFARSAYYKARAYAERGDMFKARDVFSNYKYDNLVYFLIYLTFWFPKKIWKNLNLDDLKRIPIISGIIKKLIKI